MAMLQAARARRLGLSEDSAFSWGLNRAIFYAAAKRGFRGPTGGRPTGEPTSPREDERTYYLGDDMAYRDPSRPTLQFTIGGETQTEADFRRQIAGRFGDERNFAAAWKEARAIVDRFDEEVLRSGHQFYSTVYKPRRDELVEEWSQRYPSAPPAS